MDNQRLRQLVTASGENQKEIAEKLSISQQRFNSYVTGKREPDHELLLRIVDHFNTTADYLLGRDDEKKEPTPNIEDGLSAEQAELVNLYKAASPELQAAALAVLKSAEGQDKGQDGASTTE